MSKTPSMDAAIDSAHVEERTQAIGKELWSQLKRRTPTVFERRWWLDHILDWAMQDEAVKVQMFRFVDVLPMLKSSASLSQHLQEYFEDVRSRLPYAARLGLDVAQPDSLLGKALALNARTNVRKMAERFIAGSTPDDVFKTVSKLRKRGLAFTLDLLGEQVICEQDAIAYRNAYLTLIRELAPRTENWIEDLVLDRDSSGFVPRCHFSLRLSSLTSHFKPMDPKGTAEKVLKRLRPILRRAQKFDASIQIDMESYAYKNLILEIFKEVAMEEEFRNWPHFGITIQAYLLDSESDLKELRDWARDRGTPVWVRLVKGNYWNYETINADYKGWPCPVFREKKATDANFEKLTRFLFENHQYLKPAIGSHNFRSIAHAMALAEAMEIPKSEWEIRMMYGSAEEIQQLVSERGYRVRIYAPFGEMLPGMSFLVRRLLENTSNESFLRSVGQKGVNIDELLQNPAASASQQA
jgi:RHH-type proline utilization regulon transcriptional repressor/proline dehydrogenase/delta 1-pyrroline-5-carboxylate dehydrogenase